MLDAQEGGEANLSWSLHINPCLLQECEGGRRCAASDDWSLAECRCLEGTLEAPTGCVDDPCDPDPCTAIADRTVCRQHPPDFTGFDCACRPGYVEDGERCAPDPEGAPWTVLVYLNGDNDLSAGAARNLDEMLRASAAARFDDTIHLLVLHDGPGDEDTRLLRIHRGGAEAIDLADLGIEPGRLSGDELDLSDWRTLRDFGVWGIQTHPSRRVALILWDHGTGWRSMRAPLLAGEGAQGEAISRGFARGFSVDVTSHPASSGDESPEISIAGGDFSRALDAMNEAAGRKLDLVGFDACLMGMYEVATATAPYADFLVASEARIPATGWPYEAFLSGLFLDNGWTAERLGREIVDAYHGERALNLTLSLVRLDALEGLHAALSDFSDALLAAPELFPTIELARASALDLGADSHRDLGDFALKVQQLEAAPRALADAAQGLHSRLGEGIVHLKNQVPYGDAQGLAIYLPAHGEAPDEAYFSQTAAWSSKTRWGDFLKAFGTQR